MNGEESDPSGFDSTDIDAIHNSVRLGRPRA